MAVKQTALQRRINADLGHRKNNARKALRMLIDGETQIAEINSALGYLTQARTGAEYDVLTGQWIAPPPLDPAQTSAINAELNARFKLLNKILPDVKSVELKGDDDGTPLVVKLVQFGAAVAQQNEEGEVDLF